MKISTGLTYDFCQKLGDDSLLVKWNRHINSDTNCAIDWKLLDPPVKIRYEIFAYIRLPEKYILMLIVINIIWSNQPHRITCQDLYVSYSLEILFTLTVKIFTTIVLKIKTVRYTWGLWKFAQSCKQLRWQCPPDPLRFTCLTLSISKLPWSFEIHWLKQYLVNIILLLMKDCLHMKLP